ncbi:hypothetical protein BDZ97DRAFT_1753665 [Flammula alnicola]|nr:hypothetical protein BDZ97DRAFT_1753665 [Flammula alnicola]
MDGYQYYYTVPASNHFDITGERDEFSLFDVPQANVDAILLNGGDQHLACSMLPMYPQAGIDPRLGFVPSSAYGFRHPHHEVMAPLAGFRCNPVFTASNGSQSTPGMNAAPYVPEHPQAIPIDPQTGMVHLPYIHTDSATVANACPPGHLGEERTTTARRRHRAPEPYFKPGTEAIAGPSSSPSNVDSFFVTAEPASGASRSIGIRTGHWCHYDMCTGLEMFIGMDDFEEHATAVHGIGSSHAKERAGDTDSTRKGKGKARAQEPATEPAEDESGMVTCKWDGCFKQKTRSSLMRHVETHLNIRYKCPVCPFGDEYKHSRKNVTQKHLREKHQDVYPGDSGKEAYHEVHVGEGTGRRVQRGT